MRALSFLGRAGFPWRRLSIFRPRRILAAPIFSVILAVHRPPICLPFAIRTIQAQTLDDFELFIVCDGAPDETIACAEHYAGFDPRIRVLNFPKAPGWGEIHWHAALSQATGRYVAHIEDDDLWFPNHLAELKTLLDEVDFGHVIHTWAMPDGRVVALPADLGSESFRRKLLEEKFNRIGFSVCGYRLEAYRRLAEGWAPTPPGVWIDLHMWRKFLARDDMKIGTRMAITALVLMNVMRKRKSMKTRARESEKWFARVSDEEERAKLVEAAWRSIVNKELEHEELQRTKSTAPSG